MATLNQFQTYSQGENTVTNNVLLMLSNLYDINPIYYEELIKGIIEDSQSYEVTPTFLQQVGNQGNGIIDGFIQTKASKIIIETKLNGTEWINKLLKYTESFATNEIKLLFHLSTDRYPLDIVDKINQRLKDARYVKNISFHSITYKDLVDQLSQIADNYQFEYYLQRLSHHFNDYCLNMNLIPSSLHVLRAMACGQSFDLNVKYKLYFDLASRGYRNFNYLGIYKWKSVRYIGKVENNIVANWNHESGLEVIEKTNEVTEDQKERLEKVIIESEENGWDISTEHRFFLLRDFHKTSFLKSSPGGIFRVRYFNLEDYLDDISEDLAQIAEQLTNKTWE